MYQGIDRLIATSKAPTKVNFAKQLREFIKAGDFTRGRALLLKNEAVLEKSLELKPLIEATKQFFDVLEKNLLKQSPDNSIMHPSLRS